MAFGMQKILVAVMVLSCTTCCNATGAGGGAASTKEEDDDVVIVAPLKPTTKKQDFERKRQQPMRRSASLSSVRSEDSELLEGDDIVWPGPVGQTRCSLLKSNSGSFSSSSGYVTPYRRGSTPEGTAMVSQHCNVKSSMAVTQVQLQANAPVTIEVGNNAAQEVALLREQNKKLLATIQSMNVKLFRYEETLLGIIDLADELFPILKAGNHDDALASIKALDKEARVHLRYPARTGVDQIG